MPLYDWQRLFEAEGVDLKAISESENQEHHFVKTILIHHEGCFFESYENDYEEDDEEAQRMRLDCGGGRFLQKKDKKLQKCKFPNIPNMISAEISQES